MSWNRTAIVVVAAILVTLGSTRADGPDRAEADRKFDALQREADKNPGAADWKALREAFSHTSFYQPYDLGREEKLQRFASEIAQGNGRKIEADILVMVDRERSMRFETLAVLIRLYQKTDRPALVLPLKKQLDALLDLLLDPELGGSFSRAVPVLYIEEEYLVVSDRKGLRKQKLVVHDGHRFDVLEFEADGDQPARSAYFNIDLFRNAKSIFEK